MLPDRVSNPGPLTYESVVLPIALRGPAFLKWGFLHTKSRYFHSKIIHLRCDEFNRMLCCCYVYDKHLRLCQDGQLT